MVDSRRGDILRVDTDDCSRQDADDHMVPRILHTLRPPTHNNSQQ